jgi:hypothetical protein
MFVTTVLITVHGWMDGRTNHWHLRHCTTNNQPIIQCPMIQEPANTTKRTKTTNKKQQQIWPAVRY